MKQRLFLGFALLCTIVQMAWAWDGSGTQTDPFKIQTSADWRQFARSVREGYSFYGKFFEMTADIDAEGSSAGTELFGFSGTFDGGGVQPVNELCAPFIHLDGATIRHLKVTGTVYSSHKFAAGIASLIDGTQTTTIDDCHVSSELWADNSIISDATFGGLVGAVSERCTQGPVVRNSSFTGEITAFATCSAGLVGYTFKMPVTFEHCLFDPRTIPYVDGCATFVRTAPGVECSFKECYFTQVMGTEQGEAVFSAVEVPEGCTGEIVSEPTVNFDGNRYWQNGATIRLTAPDDADFNHWETNSSCYINDPWQRSGTQVIGDVKRKPSFTYINYMPKATLERTMDGTKYRYLSRSDYHLYLSDEVIAQKSYHFDDDGELFKWDAKGNHVWITAVVGWEPGKIPSDGAQIHNDLSGWGRDYTFMGVIAPHAFEGCTELKTLYFKDTDANNYNARAGFDFIIGKNAFANCPNLTEIKMMQYTTEGDNHWEALSPDQVTSIGSGVFSGSPQAYFSTDASEYQNYLASKTWKEYQNRIIVYNHTNVDMTVNGAKYTYVRNTKGEPLKNSADGNAELMQTLRLWNADYQEFADSYLKSNDGVMRIYNDPGSYYNYKTIAIGRNAFKGSKELKAVEFWQTNGRSENSLTDMKLVIQNGAFYDCPNLKELRMYYYAQDGDDHWTVLGPKDVIPGDNIFGLPTDKEIAGGLPDSGIPRTVQRFHQRPQLGQVL